MFGVSPPSLGDIVLNKPHVSSVINRSCLLKIWSLTILLCLLKGVIKRPGTKSPNVGESMSNHQRKRCFFTPAPKDGAVSMDSQARRGTGFVQESELEEWPAVAMGVFGVL
jgi:hypothetical protein